VLRAPSRSIQRRLEESGACRCRCDHECEYAWRAQGTLGGIPFQDDPRRLRRRRNPEVSERREAHVCSRQFPFLVCGQHGDHSHPGGAGRGDAVRRVLDRHTRGGRKSELRGGGEVAIGRRFSPAHRFLRPCATLMNGSGSSPFPAAQARQIFSMQRCESTSTPSRSNSIPAQRQAVAFIASRTGAVLAAWHPVSCRARRTHRG
jgi:hypothetical protein